MVMGVNLREHGAIIAPLLLPFLPMGADRLPQPWYRAYQAHGVGTSAMPQVPELPQGQPEKMLQEELRAGHILPGEEKVISGHHLPSILSFMRANRGTVLVVDHARWLVEYTPATFPGAVRQVDIFDGPGGIEFVEAIDSEEFPPIHRYRPAEGVGDRHHAVGGERWVGERRVGDTPLAAFPRHRGERFIAPRAVLKRYERTRADGEQMLIGEVAQERREKAGLHLHVVIEENDNLAPGDACAPIAGALEAAIACQCEHLNFGVMLSQEPCRIIAAPIIDNDDFDVFTRRRCFAHDRVEIAGEQFPAIVRRDYDTGNRRHNASCLAWRFGRRSWCCNS